MPLWAYNYLGGALLALVLYVVTRYIAFYLMSSGGFTRQFEGRLGFRVAWTRLGAYCLVFDRPGWGGVLRIVAAPLARTSRLTFVGMMARPLSCLRIVQTATTSDVSTMKTSFDEHILPLLQVRAAEGYSVDGAIGGHRVELTVIARKGEPTAHFTQMLELVEQIMIWTQESTAVAESGACRACGRPGGESECDRCHGPYHETCWKVTGLCQAWGCGSRQALLDALQRSP